MFSLFDNRSIFRRASTPDDLWYFPSRVLHKYPTRKDKHRLLSMLPDRSEIRQKAHAPSVSLFLYILLPAHTRKASICISFLPTRGMLSRNFHCITMVLWEVLRVRDYA